MKYILIVLSLFSLTCYIHVTQAYAIVEDNTRMLHDPGVDGGGSTEPSLIQTFVDILFGGNGGSSGGSNSNPVPTNPPAPGNLFEPSPPQYVAVDPTSLLQNEGLVYSNILVAAMRPCLSNKSVYEQASSYTGIPWQVLAGIHSKEGSCRANGSLVSGRAIGTAEPDIGVNCSSFAGGLGKPKVVPGGCGFNNLLDSAIYAGNHLKGKISKVPETHQELAKALSRYNGGGNSNCRGGTNYNFCPPAFEGQDDTYVFNKNPDGMHETMYLRYCFDGVLCNPPRVYEPAGVMTAAGIIDQLSKGAL